MCMLWKITSRMPSFSSPRFGRGWSGRRPMGTFLLGTAAEPSKVLIVLSGPTEHLQRDRIWRPIEAAPEPWLSKVDYGIRYLPRRGRARPAGRDASGRGGRGMAPTGTDADWGASDTDDSLARTLKPLAPRVFDGNPANGIPKRIERRLSRRFPGLGWIS